MEWLEIAWAEVGTAEIAGPEANPAIIRYFEEIGRGDILSDETAWCMSFVLYCLARSGIPINLPEEQRLLARSGLRIGVKLEAPRVGAVCILSRGDSTWQGHIGFVTAWTPTHVKLLGGNQANSVNESWHPIEKVLGYRWPAVPVTSHDLKDAGSRTVKRTREVEKDGVKSLAAEGFGELVQLTDKAVETKQRITATHELTAKLASFGEFCWDKLPVILTCVAVYFLCRMIWNAGWISFVRVEDHNTGAHVGREVETEVEHVRQIG